MSTAYDILIVGGGAAGVGAARTLAGRGPSTLLLEASTRIGGRAWTREIGGLDLDLGAGWLHSADRNSLAALAASMGVAIDKTPPAWGFQFRDLGFGRAAQAQARHTYDGWVRRLADEPPASDRAADALRPEDPWNVYASIIAGFISGAPPGVLSARDYAAYDEASTEANWRLPSGYGALVARSLPRDLAVQLATPAEAIELTTDGVRVRTPAGPIEARAAILTVSTAVLTSGTITLPRELDPWLDAARRLPLGHTEKLFLEIVRDAPFEPDKQVLGDPRDPATGSYYLRPFDLPVVECFLSADGTRVIAEHGAAAAFDFAIGQLASLFGSGIRNVLRPLAASSWSRSVRTGGAYSYALPGHAGSRQVLASPFDGRLFFAGEATSTADYSTVHGAFDSGIRAANEAIAVLAHH